MQNRPGSAENRIFQLNRSARYYLYISVAAGFLAAACIIILAGTLSVVVDRVFLKSQTLLDVVPLLSGLLIIAFIRASFIWGSDVLSQRSANIVKASLRERLTSQLFILGPAYTQKERSGELVNTIIEGVEVLDEYITTFLTARYQAGLVPLMVLIAVLYLDPPTALILIFTGAILILELVLIGGRAKDITERRFIELSWMSAFFLDMLQGLASLKMFGRSREQIENIHAVSQHYGNTTMEVLRTAFQTSLVLEWGGTIATAIVAVQISLRLMNTSMSFDRALAVLIITPEFFLPLRQLALRYHAGTAGKTAANRIFTILDMASNITPLQKTTTPVPTRLDICFNTVSFAYNDSVDSTNSISVNSGRRQALRDVSLNISPGETVALVGATGAGKTTLANLLLRFIEPDQGEITVGGVSLRDIDLTAWRSQVAWVPQIPHLFHGTIAENIRIAKSEASEAELVAAARAAHIHEFIQELPQGYNTQIGEKGARLSGGQRQRIALARAFLKDAPILILDEATSHLDPTNEAAIQDALTRLMRGRTVLIIAHSLKLAYTADQVAVLDQGRIVEFGNPDKLLTDTGPYRQLVSIYEGGKI